MFIWFHYLLILKEKTKEREITNLTVKERKILVVSLLSHSLFRPSGPGGKQVSGVVGPETQRWSANSQISNQWPWSLFPSTFLSHSLMISIHFFLKIPFSWPLWTFRRVEKDSGKIISSLFVPFLSFSTTLELFQASALGASFPFHYSIHRWLPNV